MKANKDHISLETAKLLRGCGIKSRRQFYISDDGRTIHSTFPKFTWQEILWERAEKFFGSGLLEFRYDDGDELNDFLGGDLRYPYSEGACIEFTCKEYRYHAFEITLLLQEANYEGADLYFREHCILINKINNVRVSKKQ